MTNLDWVIYYEARRLKDYTIHYDLDRFIRSHNLEPDSPIDDLYLILPKYYQKKRREQASKAIPWMQLIYGPPRIYYAGSRKYI